MKLSIKVLSLFLIVGTTAYAADTASILPPAKTQFLDSNGKPLTSGKVDFYIPSTTTRKATWQDAAETIPNANPVILDAAGRALILGSGSYRQVVRDRNNNIIWDQVTSSNGTGGNTPSLIGDGLAVGTILTWAGITPPSQYLFAYGQEIARTNTALFAAITSSQAAFCTSGSPTLTGIADTTNFPINSAVETSCLPAGFSTIVSKTASTVTLAANANISVNTTVLFLPWGRGNGTTTINLPDFRGRVIAGNNIMGGTASSRLTSVFYANDPNGTGSAGGSQSNIIGTSNLPPYTPAGTNGTSIATSTTSRYVKNTGTITSSVAPSGGALALFSDVNAVSMEAVSSTVAAQAFIGTAQGGLSTPFGIMQPTITSNYIIKVIADVSISTSSIVISIGGMTGAIICGSGLTCASNTISSTSASINAGSTVVNGGPGVLQNAVNGGPLISSLTLPSGLTIPALTATGSFTATGLVTNADLVNSSLTINSTSCTLGSSCSVNTVSIIAGSTIVTGGPGILQNSSSGGTLVSSTILPTLTGNVTISKANANITLNKLASGQDNAIFGENNGLLRWNVLIGDSASESGSNAGSNFQIVRYNDAGALIGSSFSINRATGIVSIPTGLIAGPTSLGTVSAGTWQGSNVDLLHGGTNASLTASNGGIVYSTASAISILAGTVTAGQCLLSGSFAPPTWGSCAGAVASVSSVADAGSGTLTITPTTGNVLASINLAHANIWTGLTTVQSVGAIGIPVTDTATIARFFDGNAGSPHTANTPSVSISRVDALNAGSGVLTGGAPALLVEVSATGTGLGNPNSNAIAGNVTQFGVGDVVGIVGQATMSGSGTHFAYGGFFAANTTVATGQAFAAEHIALNNSGFNETYSGTAQTTALHLGSDGAYRAGPAIWIKSNTTPGFDVGIALAAGSTRTVGYQDDSASLTVLKATGTHTNGVDFSSASMTTPFKSNGFSIDNNGIMALNGIGAGVAYGSLGSGINSIGSSNAGQFVFAVQNSHGAIGDFGMLIAAGSSTTTDGSTEMIRFYTSGLSNILGSVNRGGSPGGVQYSTLSDIRGKPNRERLSLNYARFIIDKLEMYDYDKDGNAIRGIGGLAQQLYSVHKSLAIPGKNPDDWWQAEKAGPVPFLIANMQQANSRLDVLENRLSILEKSLIK